MRREKQGKTTLEKHRWEPDEKRNCLWHKASVPLFFLGCYGCVSLEIP